MAATFVDIHCHLLPDIDDGPADVAESLAMAELALADGITVVIATPHQLGSFGHNHGAEIRRSVAELQSQLDAANLPLRVLPGADIRIEPGLIELLESGDVLTLGDRGRHVLLELPHELYLPLEPLIGELSRKRIVAVLSHPERNQGILRRPELLGPLVDAGCLMQITAGSLCGSFGSASQQLAEQMFAAGQVHFVATDAHGIRSRRPLLRRAYDRVAELTNSETADDLCRHNPACVAEGLFTTPGHRKVERPRRPWWTRRTAVL